MAEERTVVREVPNAKYYSDGTLMISNVRFSFPHIFEPFEGENDDGKKQSRYGVKAAMPKDTHAQAIELTKKVIAKVIKDNNKDGKVKDLPAEKKFLRDGDDLGKEEFEGAFVVSASESKRPLAYSRSRTRLESPDQKVRYKPEGESKEVEKRAEELFYGGMYGNVLLRPWWQNHQKYGKRVNCGLVSVQFVKDGEPFGEGRISEKAVEDSFEQLDSDDGGFGDDDDFGGL